MIRVIKDTDAFWEVDKYEVVLIGCSTYCNIESGFGGKLKNRFPIIQETDDKTPYADTRKLGTHVTIDTTTPIFSLLYISKYPTNNKVTVDYDALEKCLKIANAEFKGKKVITTLLGTSRFDGQGDKEKCLEIIKRCCTDMDVDVYDYEQLTMRHERNRQFHYMRSIRYTDPVQYQYLYEHQEEILEELYIRRKKDEKEDD